MSWIIDRLRVVTVRGELAYDLRNVIKGAMSPLSACFRAFRYNTRV